MEKEQRTRLQKATQDARKLLEEEFRSQLLQTYDIDVDKVRWAEEPGAHLLAEQRLIRENLIAWIEHKEAQINDRKEALLLALREMAFTALNRFVALKLMEARDLVRPCVSGGLESAGFLEFTAVTQGLLADQESSYRLYLETIFEDVSRELRALFDPRDPASLLWPRRAALLELLDILNRAELAGLWSEDETLGWVYQYFNGDDERQKMRKESSAPRNSRELAVRNQFFTPRYVVEFLIDNTLGRIWHEMRQGKTGLKERCRYLVRQRNEIWLQPGDEVPENVVTDEALSQEELLRKPVHIPHRQLKDPREIRMLDPACGSMHFGLYAFDLYLEIYAEAWEIAQVSDERVKQSEAFAPFTAYAAGFADKEVFLREVPRLILLHNIHGVDIDHRATQIARLTLWLRAQRAWKVQQVEITSRPRITRANVVCAEPMPGERELLLEFLDNHFPGVERGLYERLLVATFDKMRLAGEAGTLLQIENEIKGAIDEEKGDWQLHSSRQLNIFLESNQASLGGTSSSLDSDISGLTRTFWHGIEERVYSALQGYAKHADSKRSYLRRLFAADSSAGFGFIEICQQKYDLVVTNPPFGLSPQNAFEYAKGKYPIGYTDLLAAFVERAQLLSSAYVGAITSRSFMVATRLSEWRRLAAIPQLVIIADLGKDVMDNALVEASAYVLSKSNPNLLTVFDCRHDLTPSESLSAATQNKDVTRTYVLPKSLFALFPGFRIVYSLSHSIASHLQHSTRFEPSIGTARQGLATWDDSRFVRAYWEVDGRDIGKGKCWEWIMKGGPYSRYRMNLHLVMQWSSEGRESRAINIQKNGTDAQSLQASEYWRRPGLAYTRRSSKGFSARVLPEGCLFTSEGPLVASQSQVTNVHLLGWINSSLITSIIEIQANAGKHLTGLVKNLPWVDPSGVDYLSSLEADTEVHLYSLLRLGDLDETDPYFCAPPLDSSLRGSSRKGEEMLASLRTGSESIDRRWNDHVNSLYGVTQAEVENLRREVLAKHDLQDHAEEAEADADSIESWPPSSAASAWLSYSIGVVFGRWVPPCKINTLKEERSRINPFTRILPLHSPMLKSLDESIRSHPSLLDAYAKGEEPASSNTAIEEILVNDRYHPLDILSRVRSVFDAAWQGGSESVWQELLEHLPVSSQRDWFRKSSFFFADHLKRYSKSRRQAPIYWQLSAGSGSYSVWLYYHRITQDTLYRLLRDFVEPRIQQAEREQFELESQGTLSGDAATRFQEAQALLQDLRLFKSELDLVAPIWNPILNDGVIISHAILWRITPYTPWQKKCKECWDKLVNGDYDWAHLAFHLWPERVIRSCTTDRSLAIAHGLEDRLWQETNNGNWLPRQLSEAELQALISEHTKPAVKNALERFLAAPPPVAPTRTRASRSTRASGSSVPRRTRGTAAVVDAEATRQVLLALTAAPSDGLAKAAIADLIGLEANALTAVIKQLKESGQIDQLGERRGARYVLSEQGRAAVASETEDQA
jgi:hypothetical protein